MANPKPTEGANSTTSNWEGSQTLRGIEKERRTRRLRERRGCAFPPEGPYEKRDRGKRAQKPRKS